MGSMERCQRVIAKYGSESNLIQIGQLTKFYCFKQILTQTVISFSFRFLSFRFFRFRLILFKSE